MLISLASLDADFGIWMTAGALAVIALGMTLLVYGAVALLVKIDDVGLGMAESSVSRVRSTGEGIVRSMPTVFRIISIIGTVAMLWVGGHLVIANLAETFWGRPVQPAPAPRLCDRVARAGRPSGSSTQRCRDCSASCSD